MIKKAIAGLLLAGAVILIVLVCLGFSYKDLRKLVAQKPYDEALKEGSYLKNMEIWVNTKTLSGNYNFSMTIENPTPRPLILKGTWQPD